MAESVVVREWLAKADEDFHFAEANLREGSGFFAQICFHFQQAAEKYLKAYIIAEGLPFDKVHDLTHLLNVCATRHAALSCHKEAAILLTTAYIETRYPVAWPTNYTRETAEQARDAAMVIGQAVRSVLCMK